MIRFGIYPATEIERPAVHFGVVFEAELPGFPNLDGTIGAVGDNILGDDRLDGQDARQKARVGYPRK